jgi:NAD(P)-dependent dehydrogenase (short-subunit alcohol dehydrogenase family)
MRFKGKVVAISGAGGGIGTALTRSFLDEGAKVFAADQDQASLDRLVAGLVDNHQVIAHVMDVSSEEACGGFADHIADHAGCLDILINNAGYFPTRAFEEMTYTEWRRVCEINLDSVFLMSKSLVPLLKKGGSGRIVNIGSSSFFRGPASQCHYVAAKAGVIGFTRSLANAVGQYGITVNVVTPGLTATPGAINVFDVEQLEARAKMRPIARVQIAQDVVGAVTFLASADAAFITGQIINVDGGVTMH